MKPMEGDFLYHLYQKYASAFKHLLNQELADDVVQEVFCAAVIKIPQIIRSASPIGWLMNALKLQMKYEKRKTYRLRELPLIEGGNDLSDDFTQDIALAEQLPGQLKREERDLLIGYYEQEKGYDQIAEELGITVENCRVRMQRARDKCRKYWKGED